MTRIIIVLCILAGIGRFTVPGHGLSWPGTYEALAHIWVGILLAWGLGLTLSSRERRVAWTALTVISLLELVMFLARP